MTTSIARHFSIFFVFTIMARTKTPPSRNPEFLPILFARGRRLAKLHKARTVSRPMVRFRCKPGTRVLQEIRQLQRSTRLVLPLRPFQRLVKEITRDVARDYRFQTTALLALQEASEAYLTGVLAEANRCSAHSGRKTVTLEDMRLSQRIRSHSNINFPVNPSI